MFMQVRDEAAWAAQLIEFEADDVSRKFKDFLLTWVTIAEELIESGDPESAPHGHDGQPILGYAKPVSKALQLAEQTMSGFLSVEWISQMLLVMVDHWVHGAKLYDWLSFIEQRLVDQATAMKLAELQASAASE